MGFWSNVDRPTMRYELLGVTITRGQWKWKKERAVKAVENYKEYVERWSKRLTLEEYWEKTGKQLEFIRKLTNRKYPEYWIPPREETILGSEWLDIEAYNYSTGFPTEKHEQLLERIIVCFSQKGDLVADFFCGSGTTLAVAEKLGRQWIGADLSKFAIHTTRKRLLDIPDCKSFEVLNLGKYQKAKLKENGVGRYIDFILKLYRAEAVSGYMNLHGKKAGRMVHVGDVDSIVTEREIRETVKECASIGAKSVDILGWDFEMGLHDLVDRIGGEHSVKIHLSNPKYLPEEVRQRVKKFTDYIDYWAVDFNYRDDTFHNMWQSFRTKKHPALETKCSHTYEDSGSYQVLVKVVDIFGNDTNKILEVRV